MNEDLVKSSIHPHDFPRQIHNRPGLPHISFRIGTYSDFLEAMLRHLNTEEVLREWTHRKADDPGIALLEGASILADILTFYQELYANEAYLRTARWRDSIGDLVRLLGYRLSPGVGGQGTFAFEVKGDSPVVIPARFPVKAEVEGLEKPADFETVESAPAYPWLGRFNLYRPLHPEMITPDTKELYICSPDQADTVVDIQKGDRLLVGEASPGGISGIPDQLLNAEIAVVDNVRELHGLKILSVKGSLKHISNVSEVVGFKIDRSFRHFGHNAPPKIVEVSGDKATEKYISYRRYTDRETSSSDDGGSGLDFGVVEMDGLEYWIEDMHTTLGPGTGLQIEAVETHRPADQVGGLIQYAGAGFGTDVGVVHEFQRIYQVEYKHLIVDPPIPALDFPLDSEVDDLSAGTYFLIQVDLAGSGSPGSQEATYVREIARVRSGSQIWGTMTGATSILTLNTGENLMPGGSSTVDIRRLRLHEAVSPLLRLRAAFGDESRNRGRDLYFHGTAQEVQALAGRRLLFEEPGTDPYTSRVGSVQTSPPVAGEHPYLRRITLDDEVDYGSFPHENPATTVYGNLVDATQGKTEKEAVLGNGDARQKFQTFKLPKSPLTYHTQAGQAPPEVPELDIYVSGRLWTRVASFFARRPDETIYIVREDPDGDSWVQFGDGKTGRRLPSGIGNVVARYRTGTGAYGALKAETTVQASGKLTGLDKIQLPGVVSGGDGPEGGDSAREAAPGRVQSLDRLVSLGDFETETLSIPGVSKVSAEWDLEGNVPAVVLTVLMERGRTNEFEKVEQMIADYNHKRGPRRFPVRVHEGRREYVRITANVGFDTTYSRETVTGAIGEALGAVDEENGGGSGAPRSSGLFSIVNRRFGQGEYASRTLAAIQNVNGVQWVRLVALKPLGSKFGRLVMLRAFPVDRTLVCGKRVILALRSKDLRIVPVDVQTAEGSSDGR